jgi:hypothetical protein
VNHTGAGNRKRDQRPEGPRRVRHGLKLKNRDGLAATTWIARRWLSLMEQAIDAAARDEGLQRHV